MLVKIRNFQSLKSVDLDLSGFSVITGPSNVGKSAIVRAIQAALFGLGGDFFITDKPKREEQCAVSLVVDKDTVKWWKVRNGAATPTMGTSLEVNGTKYSRFGREQSELTKSLGFVELEVANLPRIRPQIASQFDQIFLLSGSDTEAAETLKLLGRVDVVTEAQRLSAKDAKEVAGKLKVRKEDQEKADAEVKSLEWVTKVKAWFEELQILWGGVAGKQKRRERLVWLISEMKKVKETKVPEGVAELPEPKFRLLAKVREAGRIKVRKVPDRLEERPLPFIKAGLISKIRNLYSVNQGYYQIKLDRENAERELEVLVRAKKIVEKELGRCPLCDRGFDQIAAS